MIGGLGAVFKNNTILLCIIAVILAFAVGLGVWHLYFSADPTYSSTVGVIVNGSGDSLQSALSATNAINSAAAVILSDTFTKENIAGKLSRELSVSEIKESVRVKVGDGVSIVYISVSRKNADEAMELARAYYEADYSYVEEKVKGCRVATFSDPSEPVKNTTQSGDQGGFFAGFLAAATALGIILLIRYISIIRHY